MQPTAVWTGSVLRNTEGAGPSPAWCSMKRCTSFTSGIELAVSILVHDDLARNGAGEHRNIAECALSRFARDRPAQCAARAEVRGYGSRVYFQDIDACRRIATLIAPAPLTRP